MKKKIIKVIAVICVAAIIGTSIFLYVNADDDTSSVVYKETTVMWGNVTAGVTESGSVTVNALTQDFDLDLSGVSVSTSATSSSSSGSTFGSSSGGMSGSSTGSSGGMSSGSSSGSGSGSSTAASSSSVSASLVVEQVYITEGKTVEKGDEILKLTDDSVEEIRGEIEDLISDAAIALAAAKIEDEETLISAKYEYDSYITEGNLAQETYDNTVEQLQNNIETIEIEIAELKSKIESAENSEKSAQYEAQLSQKETELEQAKTEQTTKTVEAKKTYDTAMLYYNNASYIYEQAVSSVGDATEEAEETLAQAQELQCEFEEFVGNGTIYAGYSGTIMTVNYASGDSLDTSLPLAEYLDTSSMTVQVNVTQDDISAVNIGDTVNIEFIAYEDEIYEGTVTAIGSSTTTSSTVSYPITVKIVTTPEKLLSGMTANVTFITKEVTDVLYVSNKAVTTDGTKSYIQVRDEDDNVSKIQVTTGFSDGVYVEVSGDIQEGSTVLIESRVSSQ